MQPINEENHRHYYRYTETLIVRIIDGEINVNGISRIVCGTAINMLNHLYILVTIRHTLYKNKVLPYGNNVVIPKYIIYQKRFDK